MNTFRPLSYPIRVEEDEGAFILTSRDIPHFIWDAPSRNDIAAMAIEAIEETIGYYKEPIPMPSALQAGEVLVTLPIKLCKRIAKLNAKFH